MARPNKIVLLVTGRPAAPVQASCGDFAQLVARAIGPSWPGGYRIVDAQQDLDTGRAAARSAPPAAVVITGSPASVHERAPWMVRAEAWIRELTARRIPLFGICFGHQLLGQALGGLVAPNPRGPEIGSVRIAPLADDPVLRHLDGSFVANCFHDDTITRLPAQAVVLARSSRDGRQCVRFGPDCYGVQFHPEFDGRVMQTYLRARAAELAAGGRDPARLLARAEDAPLARQVLRNFVEQIVGAHALAPTHAPAAPSPRRDR